MADLHILIGKAISDPSFCERLVRDPEGTLRENGVPPTPELVDAVKGLDAAAVQRLAAAFSKEAAAG